MTQTLHSFAGLDLSQPKIMGIINATPDSFSDGGECYSIEQAVKRGKEYLNLGVDIIDVGGESTRPGATPVDELDEISRVVPVIEALSKEGALISVDTRHSHVMEAAISAGATIINDITALTGDQNSLNIVANANVSVILMHMKGVPENMQDSPYYEDVVTEISDYLHSRILDCLKHGIKKEKIAIDPGIGFGKSLSHNLEILRRLELLQELSYPIVLGVSRKSTIAKISRGEPPEKRLGGSIAGVLAGISAGVQIVRVHDVPETQQAIAVWQAIQNVHI